MDQTFAIKISGEGLSPEEVSIGDLGKLLSSFDKSIKSLIPKEEPEMAKDIVIGLIGIGTGSAKLTFKTKLPVVMLAWSSLTAVIRENNFHTLPPESIKPLKEIADLSKKKRCAVEFHNTNGAISPAIIHPDTTIEIPSEKYIEVSTTIYGKVERVGGKKEPKALLSLPKTGSLSCDVSEEMAKKLAQRLYTWVGVAGQAKWNIDDDSIAAFQIESLTSYEDTPLSDAIQELAKITGELWKDEEDVIKAVAKLRGKI